MVPRGIPRAIPALLGIAVLTFGGRGDASPRFGVSAQGTFTHHFGDDVAYEVNRMNRGDNPFSSFQFLLISEAAVDPTTSLFLEVPLDADMRSNLFTTYLRPFARLSRLGGSPWLNLHAGKLPTLFGTYGERTASTEKGLIGTPLLYFYHTAVRPDFVPAGSDHFFEPGIRGGGTESLNHADGTSFGGIPIVYDACWDTGAELFGARNGLQYSLAGTFGTVSAPSSNASNPNDGYQVAGRLGYRVQQGPLFGLRVGASGAVGPYLKRDVARSESFPAGASVEDFESTALGLDLEFARGPWQLFAEVGRVGYEVPNVEPVLSTTAYYVELVRDFGPSWSVAARQEAVFFSDVTSSEGVTGTWDHELRRWEGAVSFRFRRGARVRAGYQVTRFPEASHLNGELGAIQLQVWM